LPTAISIACPGIPKSVFIPATFTPMPKISPAVLDTVLPSVLLSFSVVACLSV